MDNPIQYRNLLIATFRQIFPELVKPLTDRIDELEKKIDALTKKQSK